MSAAPFSAYGRQRGKTAVPILKMLRDAGFNPEEDMLMVNVLHPKYAGEPSIIRGGMSRCRASTANMRDTAFSGYGGLVVDWDCAPRSRGCTRPAQIAGAAARHIQPRQADTAAAPPPPGQSGSSISRRTSADQAEKRVYSYVRDEPGYGWKEVQLGLCRIMQDYCGDYKSKEVLDMGMWWLNSIRENELRHTAAANPHELGRTLGTEVRLSVCEIILQHCLARKSSSKMLGFERLDYPEYKEERFALYQKDGEIVYEEIPDDLYTREGSYRECYEKHGCLEEE